MRTVTRDIVGGFIFSKDNKVLLGKNRRGGVYEGSYVVPGGGIDKGEAHLDALVREMREETGLDITTCEITEIHRGYGEHEKTLRDTGERVLVKMNFYDYKITLSNNASNITIHADDDWSDPHWFAANELAKEAVGLPTARTLKKISFL